MPRENCFTGIAQAHDTAGRLEEALRWARRAIMENPRATVPYRNLIWYQQRLGYESAARRSADELRRAHPELRVSPLMQAFPDQCFDALIRAGVPL